MSVRIADSSAIEEAAALIQKGGLVAFPTETVYGLGANALDARAVAKIFDMKQRPVFDPLIVHIADIQELDLLVDGFDARVKVLVEKFWPGPLTIVLPKSSRVPDLVTSGLPTVAVRMPAHDVARRLIRAAGCPIAAPSANKFGRVSPTTAQHVQRQLPELECILDGGPTDVGIESTVITLNERGFEILRHGVVTRQDVERVVPFYQPAEGQRKNLVSPGMLKSHYSPSKPIFIWGMVPKHVVRDKAALLSFSGRDTQGYARVEHLGLEGDLKAYAVNLFAALHALEEDARIDWIVAEPVAEEGIGLAIMDKLRKAAYRYSVKPEGEMNAFGE